MWEGMVYGAVPDTPAPIGVVAGLSASESASVAQQSALVRGCDLAVLRRVMLSVAGLRFGGVEHGTGPVHCCCVAQQ